MESYGNRLMYGILLCFLGLIIGSFLNVVIYRWPRNESISYPSSHCVKCNHTIKWYDNIPVISYIFLKGKCRNCFEKISVRYPLVELITGVMFLITYKLTGFNYELIINLSLTIIFIIIIFIDIDHNIIPDTMSLSIFILSIVLIIIKSTNQIEYDYISNIIGFIIGFSSLFLIRFISTAIYKKEAMGFGDVKLFAALGLLLGLQNIILSFIISFVLAALIEVILIGLKYRNRESEIAFGPYLILGSFMAYYYGEQIITWYLSLIGF